MGWRVATFQWCNVTAPGTFACVLSQYLENLRALGILRILRILPTTVRGRARSCEDVITSCMHPFRICVPQQHLVPRPVPTHLWGPQLQDLGHVPDKVKQDQGLGVKVLTDQWALAGGPGTAAVHGYGTGAMQLVVTPYCRRQFPQGPQDLQDTEKAHTSRYLKR